MSEIKFALSSVEKPSFTKPEIIEKIKQLPEHIGKSNSQIAGHDYAIFQDKTDGSILKPIFDVRGIREQTFYNLLFDSKYDTDSSLVKLRSFTPNFICSQIINDVSFLTLTDLTSGFTNPSLMDVKIGTRTYDRNASTEKIKHESTKDGLSKTLGFRVLAIKKWIEDQNVYEAKDRNFCRICSLEEEKQIILFYLEQSTKSRTIELTKSIIDQLDQIKSWFNNDNIDLFEFIGSSIFFIYSFHNDQLNCNVKMIDFAHIYPLEGSNINFNEDKKDHNYLSGLNSLMNLIKEVIKM